MNDKLKHLKQDYNSIIPSDEFKERMHLMIKKQTRTKMILRSTACAAAACMVFVGSLNAIPAFAKEIASIPGMDGVVKVLTFGRYHVDDNNFYADVVTPQVEGLLDQELQNKLNQDFKEYADTIISIFEQDYKALKTASSNAHLGIECNYEIKADIQDLLVIDVYWTQSAGSSSTVHKYYNIDKKAGTLLTLDALFQDGADYVSPISRYILDEMNRQDSSGETAYWIADDGFAEPFRTIAKDQKFYLNKDKALVICFDQYEVGPGASGSPEFVIPNEIIAGILK